MNYTRKNVIKLTEKDMMKQKSIAMEIIYLILLMFHHMLYMLVEDLRNLYTLFLLRRKG